MKINKVLVLFLAIGIISSSLVTLKRSVIESQYKNYEVDFYYDELEKMAQQEEKTIDEILDMLKGTGIQNILLKEDTVQSMKASPNYDVETKLDGYDMIIESSDEKLINRIKEEYTSVKRDDRYVTLDDKNTLRIEGKAYEQLIAPVITLNNYGQRGASTPVWEGSLLETVGLGYDIDTISKIKSHGYGVVLVPVYNPDFQDSIKSIEKLFKILDDNALEPSHIYFSGNYVLGYDPIYMKSLQPDSSNINPLEILANGLEDRNIALGFIESSSQGGYLETEGLKQLAGLMEYEATGSYLVWDFIQTKYDFGVYGHHNGEEITNIFFRGITTRNIRLIMLKPFILDNRYIVDSSAYKNLLDDLAKRLEVHSIVPGKLKTLEYFESSKFDRMFTAFGVIALGLIILDNILRLSKKTLYSLLLLGVIPITVVYVKLDSLQNLFDKLFALLGSTLAPTLALFILMSIVVKKYKDKETYGMLKSYLHSTLVMIFLMVLCLISVVFEIAMLANNRYFLGLDAFSGVKISQMIPILMVGVIYVAYYGYKRGYKSKEVGIKLDDIKRILTDDIKIWQIALVGLTAIMILVFLRRSGNTSGTPSMFEILLRNTLEVIFPARPRTKAIFVGIPALVLLINNSYRKRMPNLVFPLAFVGAIAFVNMVNTFSHMKAPVYLSVYRTGAEIVVGALVALVVILFVELCYKVLGKYEEGKKNV